jgi:hypothetical protein
VCGPPGEADQAGTEKMPRFETDGPSAESDGSEVISRYWTGINKPHKPREIIHRLRKGGSGELPQYETNSQRMADMACKYHETINSDRTITPPRVRKEKIGAVLGRTARKTTGDQNHLLKTRLNS